MVEFNCITGLHEQSAPRVMDLYVAIYLCKYVWPSDIQNYGNDLPQIAAVKHPVSVLPGLGACC